VSSELIMICNILRTHFIPSGVNKEQCVAILFGTLGTAYLLYSLVVPQSVYTAFSPHLSVRLYQLSDDCKLTLS